MSKFQALKTLLQDAVPAIAKEGEEAAASAIAKEAEEAAAKEAFKSEFNLDVAHGSSLEKILAMRQAESRLGGYRYPRRIIQFDDGTYPYIDPKTGTFSPLNLSEIQPITEFKPNDSINGVGIFSGPYMKDMEPHMGPNYKFNEYSTGEGDHTYPLKIRGKKTFNYDSSFYPGYDASGSLTRKESFEKLSELTNIPIEELYKKPIFEIEKLVKQYPETFENFFFQGMFKTYDPKNIRSPFAAFDPAKKDSSDFMAGLGAATLGAGALSSEAKAEPIKFNSVRSRLGGSTPMLMDADGDKELLAKAPSKRNWTADEAQTFATETSPLAGLGYFLTRALLEDKKPEKEGDDAIYGGGVLDAPISPIDLISPQMVAGAAKGIGKAASVIGEGAVEGAKSLGKKAEQKFPELTARLLDNSGSIGGKTVKPRFVMPGMYSKVEQLIQEKMGRSATPEQIMGVLKEAKPEEIEYLDIPQFLEGKNKVTKDELISYIQKKLPKIKEIKLGGFSKTAQESLIDENSDKLDHFIDIADTMNLNNEDQAAFEYGFNSGGQYWEDAKNIIINKADIKDKEKIKNILSKLDKIKQNIEILENYANAFEPETKYRDWSTQGKNYTERLYQLEPKGLAEADAEEELKELIKNDKKRPISFVDSHWDKENILAHSRSNEHVDKEGRKHFLSEENQSDLHQKGRKYGYRTSNTDEELELKRKELEELKSKFDNNYFSKNTDFLQLQNLEKEIKEKRKEIEILNQRTQIPDMPFKKSWHEFTVKQDLLNAIESGADNFSWLPGQTQADRYQLSNYVKEIDVKPLDEKIKSIKIDFYDKTPLTFEIEDGKIITAKNSELLGKNFEDVIGKEMAKRIIDADPLKQHTFSGDFLKIGGEGMKGFYDKIIPEYIAKLLKPYGVKPEKTFLPNIGEVWTIKITPEMREQITKKGFPLFLAPFLMGKESEEENSTPARPSFNNINKTLQK